MARNHARIYTAIWTDPDFVALEAGPQRTYLMLISQPDLSPCGVLPYLPKRWARLASGCEQYAVEMDVKALEQARFVVIDHDTEEIAIRTFIVHDGGLGNPKMRGAVKSSLNAVHSREIRAAIVEVIPDEYRDQILGTVAIGTANDCQSNGNPDPIGLNAEVGVGGRGCRSLDPGSSTSVSAPDGATPPVKKSRRDRSTKIEEPFIVTDPMKAWVAAELPDLNWRDATRQWVDSMKAKDFRYVDWIRAWKNGMRNAARWSGVGANARGPARTHL